MSKKKPIRAIPPAAKSAAADEFPRYFPACDWTPTELNAALKKGKIEAWRVDDCGGQWFKRVDAGNSPKVIHGVPRDAIDAQQVEVGADAADDSDDEDEDDEGKIEIAANRAQWRYNRIVLSRARNVDIPWQLAAEILADANKSQGDFENDIAECIGLNEELGDFGE